MISSYTATNSNPFRESKHSIGELRPGIRYGGVLDCHFALDDFGSGDTELGNHYPLTFLS